MLAPRKTLWSTPPSAVDFLMKWITLKDGDCICDIGCGDGRVILRWAEQFYQQHQQKVQQSSQQNNVNDDDKNIQDNAGRKNIGNNENSIIVNEKCENERDATEVKNYNSVEDDTTKKDMSQSDINNNGRTGTSNGNDDDAIGTIHEWNDGISFLGIDIDSERIEQCQASLKNIQSNGIIPTEMTLTTPETNASTSIRKIYPPIRINFICANALESTESFQNANIFFLYLIPRGLKLIYPILLEHKKKRRLGTKDLVVVTYMAKLPNEVPIERGLCEVDHQPGAAWPLYLYRI